MKKDQVLYSKISLSVIALLIAIQIIQFYQTKNQLVSPLIPVSIVKDATITFVINAKVFITSFIIALLFYFFKRYWLTIAVAIACIIWQQIYDLIIY